MNKSLSVIVAHDVMISLKQAQIADATICKIEWNLVAVGTMSLNNVYVVQCVFQSPSLTSDHEASVVGNHSGIIKSFFTFGLSKLQLEQAWARRPYWCLRVDGNCDRNATLS